MNFLEMEVLALCVLVAMLGAGVIESLARIRKAIEQNYKDSLARAMSTTDLAVKLEPPKLQGPCMCEHARSDHTRSGLGEATGPCRTPNCDCQRYRPKRGPWPGEVKI